MIHRIEVAATAFDTRADVRKKKFESLGLKGKITNLEIADVYTITHDFTINQLQHISESLINPVTQQSFIDKPFQPTFKYAIEVGYLPGVTDNIASTAKETIQDSLKVTSNDFHVFSSQVTYVNGTISDKAIKQLADSLYNPLIQRAEIKSYAAFKKDKGMTKKIPEVNLSSNIKVDTVNLNVADKELIEIGKKGIKNSDGSRRGPLALDLDYMKTIQSYFKTLGRNPTDIELESIAQTWSEHCKHTIFADPIDEVKDGLYKTYIKAATKEIRHKKGKKDFCASVFTDNSGAIIFDDNYLITHKVETHNSPSALDPFGGAVTGIVGVNRDAIGFGLAAKPIINTYGFCLAPPSDNKPLYKDEKLQQKMLPPNRIMEGVIAGVNTGGNCSGIPAPQGFLYFDKRYKGKPLVFAGTVGLIPQKIKQKVAYKKQAKPGDYIVMIGGRVGKDGIHGATFSSVVLDEKSPATAVQIGDPITQKKLSDAIVKEARDLGLYNSITDNGAGGLSCAVAEMARESKGCHVYLEKVPLKYSGLEPWEIWISESQERMTLSVPKNKWNQFFALMKKRGVEAARIGEFTDSGSCVVEYNTQKIMNIDLHFLHDGLPKKHLQTVKPNSIPSRIKTRIKQSNNYTTELLEMLSRLNTAGYEFLSQQYDHTVQGSAVLGPLQGKGRINAEATVMRPVLSSEKGVILSQALYPTYSEIDAYAMAAAAIDTSVRNIVAAGGNPDAIALLDNFCWCSSNDPERLYQLKQAAKACYDYAIAYSAPFISGKDSMFNDFKGFDEKGNQIKVSIPPTLLISSISVLNNVADAISLDAKSAGDLIYVLGETNDELAGSEYSQYANLEYPTKVPYVDAKKNKSLYDAFYKASKKGYIASAQSVGRGGLAVALAKTLMGGRLGATISLKDIPGNAKADETVLFSESMGRIIVTISPDNRIHFEKLISGKPFAIIGKTTKSDDVIINNTAGKQIIKTTITNLLKHYKSTFNGY